MFSRSQFNKRLSLSGTKMKMCLVLWDRFIRVQWFIYIDQQMVVTCVWPVDAGWRNAHARETKQHLKRIGDSVSIFWADIEPDMQISPIRLSDKTSRLHPRHVVPKRG